MANTFNLDNVKFLIKFYENRYSLNYELVIL